MNCYTDFAVVTATELAETIAPFGHLIAPGHVIFDAASTPGDLLVKIFNGVINWDSTLAGEFALLPQYQAGGAINADEPKLPNISGTTVAPTAAETPKRRRRTKAEMAATQQEAPATIEETEAALTAEFEGESAEQEAPPVVTSEISTVSKRLANPFTVLPAVSSVGDAGDAKGEDEDAA